MSAVVQFLRVSFVGAPHGAYIDRCVPFEKPLSVALLSDLTRLFDSTDICSRVKDSNYKFTVPIMTWEKINLIDEKLTSPTTQIGWFYYKFYKNFAGVLAQNGNICVVSRIADPFQSFPVLSTVLLLCSLPTLESAQQ